MKVNIYYVRIQDLHDMATLEGYQIDVPVQHIGYADVETFNPDELWELCNWAEDGETEKPENLHAPICSCGSNVAFENPEDGTFHVARSLGWYIAKDKEGMLDWFRNYWKNNFS